MRPVLYGAYNTTTSYMENGMATRKNKKWIITRLRAAISAARRPHYGSNDDEIDYLHEGVGMVEDLVKELEKENNNDDT